MEAAPPPWNAPAPVWSAAAPPAAQPAAPASTDADLAAGARAQEAAVEAPPVEPEVAEPVPAPWSAPPAGMDVAATMVAPPPGLGGAEREPTTLMPAWQPPPSAPPSVPDTMAMPTRPPAAAGTGPQAELTIETGPDAGHTHRAGDHALRMGRSPDNDVILRDPATSGHHARLERRGEQFWVVDLGSTNGTFVNGESVQEKQLNHGDRLTVGQNSVHFAVLGA
ncbi:MAG: FHA domain-containing protein [Chloroflexi bacterium]|nr:MAG: FHA domain-containing protein [Chloroflexota bacterium]TMD72793.1 MAG: FHA domain-containing protein [Chloroflexota bacterium]